LVAGGSARMLAQMLMYPADALRTLAQTRSGAKTLSDLGAGVLLSGCCTTSAFALAVGGLQFAIVGALTSTTGILGASVCGGIGSCVVSIPQEVIKQRLVTGIYPTFGVAVAAIFRDEGIRGFYTAALPTMSRNVPFVVSTFCTFSALERRQLRGRDGASLTPVENLGIGTSSALFSGLLTQPFDVVKTRMMTQAATTAAPYRGVLDCVRTMAVTEGPTSFYRGLIQRSVYMGPLWAIQFAANGWISNAMLKRNARVHMFAHMQQSK